MDTCYCVFWFPTIFHCEKKRRADAIPRISIADDDKTNNLFLEITEEPTINPRYVSQLPVLTSSGNEERYDLIFTLTSQSGESFKTRFLFEDQTRNGFVLFSYDRDELINKYWDRFDKTVQEAIIEKARERVIKRIKKKYHPETEPKPDDEQIKNYMIDRILISFYHHAKQFYHEHETHSESDGKYISYYYSKERENGSREYLREPPSLLTKNNPVINWYINQFENQLVGNAENISKHYKKWSEDFEDVFSLKKRVAKVREGDKGEDLLNLIREIQLRNYIASQLEKGGLLEEPKFEEISKNIDEQKKYLKKIFQESFMIYVKNLDEGLSTLSKECTDSLIEYTYCKTLLGSKYNDKYKHNNDFTTTELELFNNSSDDPELIMKDLGRKKAFNIRNSIRYIEAIRQKCDFLGSRITEMLIEEVHGISNDNETILDKINRLTAANCDVLKDVQELTNANNTVLGSVQTLTNANNAVLGDVQSLTKSNADVLKEAEKSNETSSFLGWLSFAISLVSLGVSFGDSEYKNNIYKWILIGIAGVILVIVGGKKIQGKKPTNK